MTPSTKGPATAPRARRSAGVVVPHRAVWYQRLAAWLVFGLMRAVLATLRYSWNDADGKGYLSGAPAGPAIYCVWHNRLAVSMAMYFGYVKKRNHTAGMAAMASASKDGALLAAILECFGVHPVRGSSSRRGPQALLELTTWAERGYDLAITPDGPRGPRYIVQEGVMSLAQVTGLPIVAASCHISSKIQLKSWDGFQIPLPFARCEVAFAMPLRVPREATDAERETLRQQLEVHLKGITSD